MHILLFKLNGWPDTYDERIRILSQFVDITFIRTASTDDTDEFEDLENVSLYKVYPRRGAHITPTWIKPLVFLMHVIQAVLLALILTTLRRGRPDLIHAMDYVLGGIGALMIAIILRRPMVVSVRGYKEPIYRSILEEQQTLRARVNYRILLVLSKIVLSQADHIVTKAEYQREAVERAIDDRPEFSTIPTGVDFERFDPSTVSPRDYVAELFPEDVDEETSDSFRLLYFGQIIPQKGVDTLLNYIADNAGNLPDDLVIIIVGECRTQEFCSRIQTLGEEIPQQVLIRSSRIPFENVPDLLASVDAVTLLSEPAHEGVPRVLQEACAMEVPIIASDVSGITGAFADVPGCKLIERDDPFAFVDAVNDLYDDHPEMNRSVIRDRFDMYQNYGEYSTIYRRVVNSGRPD